MFQIRQLKTEEYSLFESKTFDAYQKLMESHDPSLIAIGAWANGMPAGLALFQKPDKATNQNLNKLLFLSLFVSSIFRKRGIASTLLLESEKLVQAKGFKQLEGQYQKEYKMSQVMEQLLVKMGYEVKPHRLLASSYHGVGLLENPLFKRMYSSLPQDVELFLWKNRTKEEEEALKEKVTKIPIAYNPFTDFYKNQLPYNSVGLRHKGKIIAWFITLPHHSPNATHYANMYAFPEYAKKGYGLALFYEAVRLERLYLGENYTSHKGVAHVYYSNPKMVKLTERKLLKYATEVVHYQAAIKQLYPNEIEFGNCADLAR